MPISCGLRIFEIPRRRGKDTGNETDQKAKPSVSTKKEGRKAGHDGDCSKLPCIALNLLELRSVGVSWVSPDRFPFLVSAVASCRRGVNLAFYT